MTTNTYFPTTIVDNFFDDPLAIRRYALEQEYKKNPANYYPGKRTDILEKLNPDLADYVSGKILSIFYPGHYNFDKQTSSTFQMVESIVGEGWVHKDLDDKLLTAIIYLSDDMPVGSGTSLYAPKQEGVSKCIHADKKVEYIDKDGQSAKEYRKENDSQFVETITVENRFNRLMVFDSHLFHKAKGFVGTNKQNTRLTMVVFFRKIFSDAPDFRYPLQNMRRF